ncbi:MAG TPA: carboxypeptidase regulatory-like domain-containing protein [Acidobacteriaceae bacterium]
MRSLIKPAFISALASLLFAAAPARSHAQVVGGSIGGTVTDATGAVISGASVVIRNQETGSERQLTTNGAGVYSAPSVPIGRYSVIVTRERFATQQRGGVIVTVGQSVRVNVALSASSVSQSVEVTDTPAPVNLSTQQTSGLVDERQVKNLPLNGRSFDQLLTLNPAAVNYTAQRSGGVGTSNSSVGNMFSVSGRRPQDNLYLLNGVEYTGASLINVTPGGTSGQLLGVDAVREFNVSSDTYSAAFGKRQGAQISIVTASGSNHVHGAAYEFLRNSALDARNYFDQQTIPEFQRNNFGASLGGPVRRDKVFLFGNYEGYRQNLGLSNVALVPDANARHGFLPIGPGGSLVDVGIAPGVGNLLKLWPAPNGAELTDPATGRATGIARAFSNPKQSIREDFGTARADYNLGTKDLLFGAYTIDDSVAHTPTANPFSVIDETLREQVASVEEQHIFSSRLLNTARFGYSRAAFYFLGSATVDVPGFVAGRPVGAIVISGSTASNGASQITGAGGNVGSNNAVARNLFTLDDHVYWTLGRHQVEIGGWLQRLQSNDNLAQNQYGQASFATLQTFMEGNIKTFTIVPAPTPLNWHSWFGAGYVEDMWKATPRLELRAGLRIESSNGWNEANGRASNYLFTDGIINTSPKIGSSALTDNRAKFLPQPRLGVAWDPTGKGATAIRGSFGLEQSLLDNLNYRLDQTAPYNATLSYSGTTVSNPVKGKSAISPSSVQSNIATPSTLAWTLRIEQQIAPQTSLTIGYIGSHSYHQILSLDANEPSFVICPNTACPSSLSAGAIYYPSTVKPNPAVTNTTSWYSTGNASYNALEVDVRRSYSNGLQLRGNFTWSKNLDNGSAWNTSVSANTPAFVSVPQLPNLDWGPAATDVRQIASLNGSYELPLGRGHRIGAGFGPAANTAISGWTISAISNLQSGFPFSPQLGYNPTGSGDTRNPVRPDVNPNFQGALYAHGSTSARANQFFNPAAFLAPAAGTVGNLRRDTLTGPGFANLDLSLAKSTAIHERLRAQFRAEFFNVLNHTNLQTPNPVVFSSGPQQSSTAVTREQDAVVSPTAGVVTAAATSRQIQFGLKLLF